MGAQLDAVNAGVQSGTAHFFYGIKKPFWDNDIGEPALFADTVIERVFAHRTESGEVSFLAAWIFAGSFVLLIVARLLAGLMAGNISTVSAVVAWRGNAAPPGLHWGMALPAPFYGMGRRTDSSELPDASTQRYRPDLRPRARGCRGRCCAGR